MVTAAEYRSVSPGSQPTYVAPRNDKIAGNYYYTRDARRNYPQTVVYKPDEVLRELSAGGQQLLASSTSATTSAQSSGSSPFFPPIINNRYNWKPASPHLKADEMNPEFSIVGRT
ncbi:hypothetical protein HK104_000148 [Borealophlyctis nickersoniae]|nr:hypothetical protein HK104_000148 [Borealophlyctis nickersoniae]